MQLVDLSRKDRTFNDETKLYKYMTPEAFKLFLERGVHMTKMVSWPDRFETAGFEFLQVFPAFDDIRSSRHFYASCWTFDIIKRGEIKNEISYHAAIKELSDDGSAAMWEAYCKKGGVRICTTIGKLKTIFGQSSLNCSVIHSGAAKYRAAMDHERLKQNLPIEKTFFFKRVGFRHEVEYRFVSYLENETEEHINVPVANYANFVDEVLVFPMENAGLNSTANDLHQLGWGILDSSSRGKRKNASGLFCRSSQLYGMVSNQQGNVCYLGQK
jgi:hypothetical protein